MSQLAILLSSCPRLHTNPPATTAEERETQAADVYVLLRGHRSISALPLHSLALWGFQSDPCFLFFSPDLKSAERMADPPPPWNPNRGSCAGNLTGAAAAVHVSSVKADMHLCSSLCCHWRAALVQTELNWHGIASFIP